ncbi:MAG: hypothetical protein QOF33_2687, partial [Thermomicrobiales bacterium]|nr:hypothetical protein [Thermomicrobiales bacterium]
MLGVHERSVRHWLAWYRAGGTAAEAATGRFRTGAEAVASGRERVGVADPVSGKHQLHRRRRCSWCFP